VGWDWAAVDGAESASGTTWGQYRVVGTWDGDRLTLTEAPGPPVQPERPANPLGTPCDPPNGGWRFPDADRYTIEELGERWEAAVRFAHEQPTFAGLWIDNSANPDWVDGPMSEEQAMRASDRTKAVLNVRFTGDLEGLRRELADRWPGAICVTKAEHTRDELYAIQEAITRELQQHARDQFHASSADEVHGVVEVLVTVAEPSLQDRYDRKYGMGVVRVSGALQPID
jgi:hypothetical protein